MKNIFNYLLIFTLRRRGKNERKKTGLHLSRKNSLVVCYTVVWTLRVYYFSNERNMKILGNTFVKISLLPLQTEFSSNSYIIITINGILKQEIKINEQFNTAMTKYSVHQYLPTEYSLRYQHSKWKKQYVFSFWFYTRCSTGKEVFHIKLHLWIEFDWIYLYLYWNLTLSSEVHRLHSLSYWSWK